MEEKKKKLLKLLLEKSFKYRTDPPFTLASGKKHPCYMDCKPVTNNAEGMTWIGEVIFALVKDLCVDSVGGLTMGADPIAHAAAMTSYQKGMPFNSFSVRKASKDHGNIKKHGVEGDVRPGDRVVILEDVITTGGSTIQAIKAAKDFGLEIVKVVALVDREAGGSKNIGEYIQDVESLFTLTEFLRESGIDPETYEQDLKRAGSET